MHLYDFIDRSCRYYNFTIKSLRSFKRKTITNASYNNLFCAPWRRHGRRNWSDGMKNIIVSSMKYNWNVYIYQLTDQIIFHECIFHIILSDTKLSYYKTIQTQSSIEISFQRLIQSPPTWTRRSLSKKDSLRECNQIVKRVRYIHDHTGSFRGVEQARWRYRDDVRTDRRRDRPSTHFEATDMKFHLRKQNARIDRNVWMACDSIPYCPRRFGSLDIRSSLRVSSVGKKIFEDATFRQAARIVKL